MSLAGLLNDGSFAVRCCDHGVPVGIFCRQCATYTVRVGDRVWKVPRMGESETLREADFARKSRDGVVTITRDQDCVAVVETFLGVDGQVALVPARPSDVPFGVEHVDQLQQPFCACGHVVSRCDGSRRACPGRDRGTP